MNVLILGSGGREHALGWKISQSDKLNKLYFAPGNAGTDAHGTNVSLDIKNFDSISEFVLANKIDMVVVGPEEPLVNGIKDHFKAESKLSDVLFIGPDANGAQLEGSKDFSKAFMEKNDIPTARALTVSNENLSDGLDFLSTLSAPYVLKADGLAAGKGVLIIQDLEEAKSSLKNMLAGQFGEASEKVLIEEYLDGIELSVFVLTDGENYKILPEAKDYKRIGENDTGPNTGGMGAVSPVIFADTEFLTKVEDRVVKPTIAGFKNEGMDYVGFIFIGLMNIDGNPFVIEYNVRMGDPETQVVMPRIKNDLLEMFIATAKQSLDQIQLDISQKTATTVVAVAGGYPGSYAKGEPITGIEKDHEAIIFQAGTKKSEDEILTNGGRVLAISGLASDINEALNVSYSSIEKISWKDMNYRKDIGQDLIRCGQ